jgi:hypothetical protein
VSAGEVVLEYARNDLTASDDLPKELWMMIFLEI